MSHLADRAVEAFREYTENEEAIKAKAKLALQELQLTTALLWLDSQFEVVVKRDDVKARYVGSTAVFTTKIDDFLLQVYINDAGQNNQDLYLFLGHSTTPIRNLVELGREMTAQAWEETGYQ